MDIKSSTSFYDYANIQLFFQCLKPKVIILTFISKVIFMFFKRLDPDPVFLTGGSDPDQLNPDPQSWSVVGIAELPPEKLKKRVGPTLSSKYEGGGEGRFTSYCGSYIRW